MLVKFIFGLLLFFYICEDISSFEVNNLLFGIRKHQPLTTANHDDKSFSTNLRTIQSVPHCSSPNCTGLTQGNFTKEAVDANEKILSQEDSASVDVLSTDTENVSSPVNQSTIIKNIQPMATNADLNSHEMRKTLPSDSYTKIIETGSAMVSSKKRAKRAATGSYQFVLRKVYPGSVFNSSSGKKHQTQKDLTLPDESSQKRLTRKSSNRRKKVTNPVADDLDEDPMYFRMAQYGGQPYYAPFQAAAPAPAAAMYYRLVKYGGHPGYAAALASANATTSAPANATTAAPTNATTLAPTNATTNATGCAPCNGTSFVHHIYHYFGKAFQ